MFKAFPLLIAIVTNVAVCVHAMAEFDVDDADSLDFESFHTNNNQDKKVGQQESKIPAEAARNSAANAAEKISDDRQHEEYEIRERYTLKEGDQLPYSAYGAIAAMHRQMAALCPNGWEKTREWSIPVDQDFYLYYELTCL